MWSITKSIKHFTIAAAAASICSCNSPPTQNKASCARATDSSMASWEMDDNGYIVFLGAKDNRIKYSLGYLASRDTADQLIRDYCNNGSYPLKDTFGPNIEILERTIPSSYSLTIAVSTYGRPFRQVFSAEFIKTKNASSYTLFLRDSYAQRDTYDIKTHTNTISNAAPISANITDLRARAVLELQRMAGPS